MFSLPLEPVEWLPAEEIQKLERLAKAVGGLHQLLSLLLQDVPGMSSVTLKVNIKHNVVA